MSVEKIGKLFHYYENGSELTVELIDFRLDPAPPGDAEEKYPLGGFQRWKWKVIWSSVEDIKPGEEFETMNSELGPSYSWHANEMDVSASS